MDILEVIVFAVGIFFFVYLLIMRPHKIKGASMMPNFPDSEFLLTEKVTYYLRHPSRGDVVVFVPPPQYGSPQTASCGVLENAAKGEVLDEFIKRIVAVPGENVMVKEGHVYINDKLLEEPYLKDSVVTLGGTFLCEGQEYKVPEGRYFVMGDNRTNSSDSRYWGPITQTEMTGRAWVIYWPVWPQNLTGVVGAPKYNL